LKAQTGWSVQNDAIRKDAPIVGGCREKNHGNRSTFER
jgi:hypothetical protein